MVVCVQNEQKNVIKQTAKLYFVAIPDLCVCVSVSH